MRGADRTVLILVAAVVVPPLSWLLWRVLNLGPDLRTDLFVTLDGPVAYLVGVGATVAVGAIALAIVGRDEAAPRRGKTLVLLAVSGMITFGVALAAVAARDRITLWPSRVTDARAFDAGFSDLYPRHGYDLDDARDGRSVGVDEFGFAPKEEFYTSRFAPDRPRWEEWGIPLRCFRVPVSDRDNKLPSVSTSILDALAGLQIGVVPFVANNLLLSLAVIVIVGLTRRIIRVRRAASGRCLACGYILESHRRCPECGAEPRRRRAGEGLEAEPNDAGSWVIPAILAGAMTLVPALVWLIANLTRPPAFGRYGRVEGPIAYAVDVACVTLAIVLFASMLWAMRRAQIARVALATSIGAFLVILIALGSMAMPDARTSSTIDVSGQSSHIRSFYRVYGRDLMPLDWWRRRSVVRDEYGPPAPDGLLLDPYGLGWEEHGLPLRFIQTPRYYGIARPDRIGLLDSIPNILGMSRIRPLALGLNIAAFALAILLMGRVLAAFARRRRALSVPRSDASSD